MTKKYKLTHHTKEVDGHALHRIKALKSFGDVKKGDLGGWVESYRNLSQSDYAWVYDKAKVYGDSILQGRISIREDNDIKDRYSYLVFNNTWSSGRQFVYVLSNQRWHVGCFDGTGEELIKKAYHGSEKLGKMYELYVHFAEQAVKTQQQLKEM